jgi:1-acyl-sn-glycerol-3-phosphate acyltransferase
MIDDRRAMRVMRVIFTALYDVLAPPTYVGREHVPPTGPFLVVTNHLSYADPPLIFLGLERNNLVVLAADKYKSSPFFKWIIETAGGVWIHREGGDRAAIKAALDVLKNGKILGMAPEGTRSKQTHALQAGKSGAAYISSKAGVPVLPVGLAGTDKIWSELGRLRRSHLTFNVGQTFRLPPLDSRPDKSKALDEYTHEIMCRIAAQLPEEYHGVYKGDSRIAEIREGKARW